MNANYSHEFIRAIDAAYSLYPDIKNYINGISVIWELEHGLGKLSVRERDYVFMFNHKSMSLDTISHEVAHMVCYCLDLPMDHGNDFIAIKARITHFCENYDRSCFIPD